MMFYASGFFKRAALAVICIACIASPKPALAGLWDNKDELGVPAFTTEQKREKRKIGASEFEFIYFSSDLSQDQIANFYRNILRSKGWNESAVLKNFDPKDLPAGTPDIRFISQLSRGQKKDLDKMLKSNMIFENAQETFMVIFLPGGYPGASGKTGYAISRGKKIGLGELPSAGTNIPGLVDRPKKDVFPVYPGSSLVNFNEKQQSLRAAYFTKDDIEAVFEFYKRQMPGYNWTLNSERPAHKVDRQSTKDCPECEAAGNLVGVTMENWSAEMKFINRTGDKCEIAITQVLPQEQKFGSLRMTTITVNYEQSAK